MSIPRGWYSRGHLPHADFAGLTQAVTFRLADALPEAVLDRMRLEVAREAIGAMAEERRAVLLRERVQAWLDSGHGSCVLARQDIQQVVIEELHRCDGIRYRLDAYVVMPNHVHVLIGVGGTALGRIVQTWKGVTARRINVITGGVGSLWQREYFDRFVRGEEHAIAAVRYIAVNPVQAGVDTTAWVREGLRTYLQGTAD